MTNPPAAPDSAAGLIHWPSATRTADLASPAIVKTLEGRHGATYPDMTWEPKAAFGAVADRYHD